PDKALEEVSGTHVATGAPIGGYEMHMGRSGGPAAARPFALIGDRPEGASSPDGRVAGTYLHGLFASDGFRRAFLAALGAASGEHGGAGYDETVERTLDALAAHLEAHLDLD